MKQPTLSLDHINLLITIVSQTFLLRRHLEKATVIMSLPAAANMLVYWIQLLIPLSVQTDHKHHAMFVLQCLLLWLMTSIKLSAAPLLPFYTYSIVSAQSDCIFSSLRTSTILLLTTSTARLQRMDFSLNSSLKPSCNGKGHLKIMQASSD